MDIVNVGVVGTGHMGNYHARIYAELLNANLVGISDINEQRVTSLAKQYYTTAYTNYTELYDKVHAVSIAVPTSLHYQVTKDFLEQGIHVLLEKPMTTNLEEAYKLIELAKKKDLILQVGHVERFNAAVTELKNVVKDPIFIECRRLSPYNRRINDTGVVLDLIIHDVDIVLRLVNDKIAEINVAAESVYSEFEDIANIQFIFDKGCIVSLTASRVTEEKIRTLAITQPNAYIFLDYAAQELHIHRQSASHSPDFSNKQTMRYKQESIIEKIFVNKDNPLKLELAHFIDCVSKGIEPLTTLEDELRCLEVTLEIQKRLKI